MSEEICVEFDDDESMRELWLRFQIADMLETDEINTLIDAKFDEEDHGIEMTDDQKSRLNHHDAIANAVYERVIWLYKSLDVKFPTEEMFGPIRHETRIWSMNELDT